MKKYTGKKLFGVIFPRRKPGFKFLSQNLNIEAMEDTHDPHFSIEFRK